MIDHHLIKSIEKDGNCIYCSEELDADEWKSSFASQSHYKCIVCSCGKKNCVRVGFIGTGHDTWSGLEKKIEKSDSIKIVEKNVRTLN